MVLFFKTEYHSALPVNKLRNLVLYNVKHTEVDNIVYDFEKAELSSTEEAGQSEFIMHRPMSLNKRGLELRMAIFYKPTTEGTLIEAKVGMDLFGRMNGLLPQLFFAFFLILFGIKMYTPDNPWNVAPLIVLALIVILFHLNTYLHLKGTIERLIGQDANT